MIEIRMKIPGSTRFVVEDLDDFMVNHSKTAVFVVRNQKEKDMLDGYGLIYGQELPIKVGPHEMNSVVGTPYFFLWVVEIEELS